MRNISFLLVGIIAGICVEAARAKASDSTVTFPSSEGKYTYDSKSRRVEIDLDAYMPGCARKAITIVVAKDRNTASAVCDGEENALLPTWQGEAVAVVWSRR